MLLLAINVADIVAILVILALVLLALRALRRSKRDGFCSGCPHQKTCQRIDAGTQNCAGTGPQEK